MQQHAHLGVCAVKTSLQYVEDVGRFLSPIPYTVFGIEIIAHEE